MVLPFSDYHNMIGNLSLKSKESKPFKEIVLFLKQSEIAYCVTANPTIYENHIREFWKTAYYKIKDNRGYMVATIQGKVLEISENTIRFVLKLSSSEQYDMTNSELIKRLEDMGYEGDAYNLKMIKSQVGYNWRYLWHVIIHVFAARKAGWDNLTLELAKGMTCLCLDNPFNWAKLILENMKNNAQTSPNKKFLLYPRFLQMIINFKVKDLNREGNILNIGVMRDRVWNTMRSDHARSSFSKKFTKLFPEMLLKIGTQSSSSSEDVPSATSTPEREQKKSQELERRSKHVEEASVSSSSEDQSVVKPKRKSPRKLIKRFSPRQRVTKRPSAITDTEDEPVVKKKKTDVLKVRIPKATSVAEESIPAEEEQIPEVPISDPFISEDIPIADKVMNMLEKVLKKQEEIQENIAELRLEMISEVHGLEDRMTKKIEHVKESIVEELERRLKKKTKVVNVEDSEETESEQNFGGRKVVEEDDDVFEKMDYDLDLSFLDEYRVEEIEKVNVTEQSHLVQLSPSVQATEEVQPVDDSMAIVVYSSPLESVQSIKKDKGKQPINDKFL